MGLSDWPRSKIHLSFNLLGVEYRKFGTTDFEVSALGLGCMRLPTVRMIPQRVDTRKATTMIRSAVDQGVNYLDTAWPYHFIAETDTVPVKILGDTLLLGKMVLAIRPSVLRSSLMTSSSFTDTIQTDSMMIIKALTGNLCRVQLPDGSTGYIKGEIN